MKSDRITLEYYLKIVFRGYFFRKGGKIMKSYILNLVAGKSIKAIILTSFGAVGSLIAGLLGGWDSSLQTLLIFMAIDYITGLIVAGVFHKSKKTESGALESRAGFMQ